MASNCKIQTPDEYVIKMLDYAEYFHNLYGKRVLENSCGKGNILIKIAQRYIEDAIEHGYSKKDIIAGLERDIVGYEICTEYVIECKKRLNAVAEKYEIFNVKWNIIEEDYLKSETNGYDYVIGNPPYITYHDLNDQERKWLQANFSACKKGRCDYFYAFLEKSIKSLNQDGRLVYLIPFSFFRNKFANDIRNLVKPILQEIHDFTGINVFQDVITSSTIIVCNSKYTLDKVKYFNEKYGCVKYIQRSTLGDKWFFNNKISNGKRFGDFFSIHNSVATLFNKAFVILDYTEDDIYIYVDEDKIEKSIIAKAISPKSSKRKDTKENAPLIIFPYKLTESKFEKYTEEELVKQFPGAYNYLKKYKKLLLERKTCKGTLWFEYGRSQAIAELRGEKLVFPSVITKQVTVCYAEDKEVPYAGIFLKKKNECPYTLKDAETVLKSEDFYEYVRNHGTPTTTMSYRISVNEINNYIFQEK